MATPIGGHVEHPAPRPVRRHDPSLWLELRLTDELAELRLRREAGKPVDGARARIDDLLDRWHGVRPCRWCLVERLDAVHVNGAGIGVTG